jgi:hypothetical protein
VPFAVAIRPRARDRFAPPFHCVELSGLPIAFE